MRAQELLNVIFPTNTTKQLTEDQKKIFLHPNGPAWVLAGPGSGKTEILSLFVLRLLYVENDYMQSSKVEPESIIVTTFTEKAAKNLEDRISQHRSKVISAYPELSAIDISKLRIGTLHGLCNDILQEYRAPNYQNVRLMDDFEQALFVREHMSVIKDNDRKKQLNFWKAFAWVFENQDRWKEEYSSPPKKWLSTKKLILLLNRIAEDRVSIDLLKKEGNSHHELSEYYLEYINHLKKNYRCDFSQLQMKFLEFLNSNLGEEFINGNQNIKTGVKWVLVDEYQDTNPIQEEIYFKLVSANSPNIMVVGDDDQAMYRFRGGSVECMVTFDKACEYFLNYKIDLVKKYHLVDNFRSHKDIVDFFNEYIKSFEVMNTKGARADKPSINARREIDGKYDATVVQLIGDNLDDLAIKFAKMIQSLVQNKIVNDPNECCLLLKSTRESARNAGKYVEALKAEGLEVYNPRNKSFTEQEEVLGLLGTLLAILDINGSHYSNNEQYLSDEIVNIQEAYSTLSSAYTDLKDYVEQSKKLINENPDKQLSCNLQELTYYIMSLEPFNTWQNDPARRFRLAKITKLLEAYSSMPILNYPDMSRGIIKVSNDNPGLINKYWLTNFYHLFIGYVLESGFDDDEDQDSIAPQGFVPIMTMHQSKGLEFPFIFVGHIAENSKPSVTHKLETFFSNYSEKRQFQRASIEDRSQMDMIRQYYVAYSRAEYSLILLGTKSQFKKTSVPLGPEKNWAVSRIKPL
jgi:DNA helicase-2/ATP-dependent DNA helicase PcrA